MFFPILYCATLGPLFGDSLKLGVKAGFTNCDIYPGVNGTGTYFFGRLGTPGQGLCGFDFGVFSDIGVIGPISFQPELLYVLKGDAANINGPVPTNISVPLPYLEMPLLLKGNVLTIQDFKTYLLLGPYLGLLTQGVYGDSIPLGAPQGFHPIYNPLDWGFDFGVSLELDNFVLDARIEQGENYIYKNTVNYGPNSSIAGFGENLEFQYSLGYEFWSL